MQIPRKFAVTFVAAPSKMAVPPVKQAAPTNGAAYPIGLDDPASVRLDEARSFPHTAVQKWTVAGLGMNTKYLPANNIVTG